MGGQDLSGGCMGSGCGRAAKAMPADMRRVGRGQNPTTRATVCD